MECTLARGAAKAVAAITTPRAAAITAVTLALPLLASCASSALPGKLLGTYKVQATPQSNTCGAGLDVPNPWVFDVQMSESGSTLYWSFLDGTPPLSNAIGSGGAVTLTTSESGAVDSSPDGGAGACSMQRNDTLTLTLATGSPPPSFDGTLTYVFAASTGAVCTDQLTASGGDYATLPCTVAMSMTASLQ